MITNCCYVTIVTLLDSKVSKIKWEGFYVQSFNSHVATLKAAIISDKCKPFSCGKNIKNSFHCHLKVIIEKSGVQNFQLSRSLTTWFGTFNRLTRTAVAELMKRTVMSAMTSNSDNDHHLTTSVLRLFDAIVVVDNENKQTATVNVTTTTKMKTDSGFLLL